MTEIYLEGLEFFSHHGCYKEEKERGNRFVVDICIEADVPDAIEHDNIKSTIDYTIVYQLVKKEMEIPSDLLEHVAGRIKWSINNAFPEIKKLTIDIAKLAPAVGGICRQTRVRLS